MGFNQDQRKYKEMEERKKKSSNREEIKADKKLAIIKEFIANNPKMEIDLIVKTIISKKWVTLDLLNKQMLEKSTKELVLAYLEE
jgi:hypothetical protein